MKKMILVLFTILTATLPGLAGRTLYAPDLNDSDARQAWLGVVNHTVDSLTVTISGYAADGTKLGEAQVELGPRARYEVAGSDLFEGLAWASIEADIPISGYTRYATEKGMSTAPLSRFAGPDFYVPGIAEDGEGSSLVLINAGEESGTVTSTPYRLYPYDVNAAHLEEPATLEGIGGPFGQLSAQYGELVGGVKQGLQWDRLQTNLKVTGVQHFNGNEDIGALIPVLTPLREMIVAPLAPKTSGYQTHFVLANTSERLMEVTLTIRDQFIEGYHEERLELEPGEKRTYTMGDPTQLPNFKPYWFHIAANENGLVGYQYTTARNGGARAFTEARGEAGTRLSLPYVRHDATTDTRVTLINPDAGNSRYHVSGFDDEGNQIALWRSGTVLPGETVTHTMTDFFGDGADAVTWLEVRALVGQVSVLSLVHALDGSKMAAMAGTPVLYTRDERKVADYEFLQALDLAPQGWKGKQFNDDFARPLFTEIGYLQEYCHVIHDGMFFTESNFIASNGLHYFGYEPRFASKSVLYETRQEEVALLSPFFEMPDYADCYVSFDLRMINPEWATAGSRYGLVWREEGSEDWQWFGLTGDILLDPPTIISDCWERVCYRNNHNEVTLTPWFSFQAALPDTVTGKRVQFGLFYNHIHTASSPPRGPTLFVDNVAVSAKPIQHALYYEDAAGMVNQQAEAAVEETP